MSPNGDNSTRKRSTRRPTLVPRVPRVPSTTETFINSLQQEIKLQQKQIKALRTKASFQQVQLGWHKRRLKPLKPQYVCWACDKNFTRQDHLHKHVRETKGDEHQVIADFIDQTFCLHCNTSFQRPRDLVKHERKHGERLKDGIGLLAESDPKSENTTLNLQVSSRDGPDNREITSIPGASVAQIIPENGWPVSEPRLSSAQYIGLPTANRSMALNEFLGAPYDSSQSPDKWTMLEPHFSSVQGIGLPAEYSTALGNEFLGAPYDGSQSQAEWGILEPGFSSAQFMGLPMMDHSTASGK